MNALDIIIGVILLIFALAGLRKGLIIEAFYLASYVVGIYGAMFFSDAMASWISDFLDTETEVVAIIAFILTFILIMVLVRFLGRMVSNLVEAIHLGFIDKFGGFVFGILKGALIVSVFILIMNVLGVSGVIDNETKRNSSLYTITEEIANVLYKKHDVVKESIDDRLEKIEDVIEKSLTK